MGRMGRMGRRGGWCGVSHCEEAPQTLTKQSVAGIWMLASRLLRTLRALALTRRASFASPIPPLTFSRQMRTFNTSFVAGGRA